MTGWWDARPDQRPPDIPQGLGAGFRGGTFRGRLVVIIGTSGGLFVYSPTAGTGNLVESIAAANGTDPYGNHYFAGTATYSPSLGQSFVVTLLSTTQNALFQYNAPAGGVQGGLILAVSATGGAADPVTGVNYLPGLYGIDPAFGDTLQTVGANIHFGQVAYTRTADVIAAAAPSSSQNPYLLVDAPEETTASHMQILMQGASPDASSAAQMLIGPVSGGGLLTPQSHVMLEVQGGTGQAVSRFLADASTTFAITANVVADTNVRYQVRADGATFWGTGSAPVDCELERLGANLMAFVTCDLEVHTAGRGLRVAEGSNAKQGTATLAAGTSGAIANTSVTANSRIFITAQDNNSAGALRVSARVAGTSFTITSSNGADSGVVAWEIFEPG